MPRNAPKQPLEPSGAKKKARAPYWPKGVDSELEMKLHTRLERMGLPMGELQYPVCEGRQFRFDRAWPDQRVAVEVQGGIWMAKGRHNTGEGIEDGCFKASLAAATGWRLLPLTEKMIESGDAVRLIAQALGIEIEEVAF